MTDRIITGANGRKHITTEPPLHPPKRKWVDLTTEQKVDIMKSTDYYNFPHDLITNTQAKLKELNHGQQ